MARYETFDQAVVDAAPAEVWAALMREFAGRTHWWLPELEFRLLTPAHAPAARVEIEVTPHVRGDRWLPGSLSFVARVSDLEENERLVANYVAGAYRGQGEWLLDPVDGRTRLSMRWQVRSHGLLTTLLGLFVDAAGIHSQMMQTGFRRLNGRIKNASAESRAVQRVA